MKLVLMLILFSLLETFIEGGIITDTYNSKVMEDNVDEDIKDIDEKHKSVYPKTLSKITTFETNDKGVTIKQSLSKNLLKSKHIPIVKNIRDFVHKDHENKSSGTFSDKIVFQENITENNNLNSFKDFNNNLNIGVDIEYEDVSTNKSNIEHVEDFLTQDPAATDKGNINKAGSLLDQEMEELTKANKQKQLMTEFLVDHTVIPTKCDKKDVLEEKKDFDEFIFLEDIEQESGDINENDYEMNTEFFVDESRFKRSVNIIDEENLGTTVSGFKFTGRDTRLSNDLFFRNIHT